MVSREVMMSESTNLWIPLINKRLEEAVNQLPFLESDTHEYHGVELYLDEEQGVHLYIETLFIDFHIIEDFGDHWTAPSAEMIVTGCTIDKILLFDQYENCYNIDDIELLKSIELQILKFYA